MPRPLRWWLHRHRPARSFQIGSERLERCWCGAARPIEAGRPGPWRRLDPWPRTDAEVTKAAAAGMALREIGPGE